MEKTCITAPGAPAALGPYSHAVGAGQFIFLSGQLGLDPVSGNLVPGDVKAQARQAMENVKAVLASQGLTTAAIVKTTIFLADMKDFAAVNEVYASFFDGGYPARSAVQVAALPKGGLVEIECIALRA